MSEVYIGDWSQDTRESIDRALYELDLTEWTERRWLTLGDAANLYFILRALRDDPAWFPRGKWATLQDLETRCDAAAQTIVRAGER